MPKKSSVSTESSTEWLGDVLAGKESLGKGVDILGRGGEKMRWYPAIGMVSLNKQGEIAACSPRSTQIELLGKKWDVVAIGRSDPAWVLECLMKE